MRKINPRIEATAFKADVLSETFGPDVVAQTLKHLSSQIIDVVISNAPYVNSNPGDDLPIAQMTKRLFDNLMTGNAWAPTQLCLAALPYLPRGGRVIFIGSTASHGANVDPVVCYGVSKAALDSFTRSLATIFSAKHGITINSVSVGATRTDLMTNAMDAGVLPQAFIDALIDKHTAEKRFAEVEDIAAVVGFLASEESRWINGKSIPKPWQ